MSKGRNRRGNAAWSLSPAAVAVVLFAAFLALALLAHPGSALSAMDARVTNAFVAARTALLTRVFWNFTLLGETQLMAAYSTAAVLLLLAWGRRHAAAVLATGLLAAQGTSSLAKSVIGRDRPSSVLAVISRPSSHSMPSGHALMTIVTAGLLVYLLREEIGLTPSLRAAGRWPERRAAGLAVLVVAAAVVVMVGLSRVYLGVHWLSDVLAGWCLGGAWLALVVFADQRWMGRVSWLADYVRGSAEDSCSCRRCGCSCGRCCGGAFCCSPFLTICLQPVYVDAVSYRCAPDRRAACSMGG
jgi:undecaprenyl-diphosphatase